MVRKSVCVRAVRAGADGRGGFAKAALAMSVSVLALGAQGAAAQDRFDGSADVPGVTVLGERQAVESPKYTAPLIDMPLTVSVIPQELFEQQGARNLTDILNNTPGITFNAGENGFATGLSNFSMRGFDTSANVFVDGARDSGSFSRDAFNVRQVEVVKGPAGDNGRGGAGGYVNIVTKTPESEAAYHAAASFGFDEYNSENRVRTTLDLNQPLSETAAARLNVLWEDGGVAGREIAGRSTFGFAPSLTVGLGTETRFTVALQHVQQEDVPDWGVPTALIEGMSRFDPALDGEALRDEFYGLSSDFDEVDSNVALARFERTLSQNLELSTQVRWAQTDREASYTLPTGYDSATQLVTTQRQAYARDNESLSSLTNLAANFSTGALRHRAAVGVEFSQEDASARSFPTQTNPGGAPVPIDNPDPDRAGAGSVAATQESDVSVTTLSAYLYDTVELSPQWEVTGGVRVESYEVEIDNTLTNGTPIGPDGYHASETSVSGRLGIVFKPVENASIYAAYGISSLPPGSFLSTSDISREGDNAFPGFSDGLNSENAKVQRSVNYEIGAKWDILDRLSATAAVFRTERRNVAITGLPALGQPSQLLGWGKHIAQGVELGLVGEITPEWSVFAGALFLDTEREHSADLDLGRCRASPGDFGVADAASCSAANATSGDALAFSPEVTANLWTTYEFPFGLTVGGGVRYVGESYVGRPDDAERIIPNNDANMLPDYWVANALVEYEINPQASVRLNIDNITDEFYAVSTNWSSQRVLLGPSRSFLLSLNLKL